MDPFYCATSPITLTNFFDFSFAPALLFYSYIPAIVLSLFFGLFVLFKDHFSLQSKLLIGIAISFSLWVLNIFFQWVAVYASIVYFSSQLTVFFEILIFILSTYFVYVFLNKHDISLQLKIFFTSTIFIILLFLPTAINMRGFDIINCEGIIGIKWYIIYGLEILSIIWIALFCVKKYFNRNTDTLIKKQILYFAPAVILLLSIFFAGNIWGEVTGVYEINLIGPIGLVLFIGILAFMIVRFKTFNIKLIGTQALVVALWILILSILFIETIESVRIIVALTSIFLLVLGILLVRNVKKEIKQREQIEKLAGDLKKTNDNLEHANTRLKELDVQKTEFVSFATHQLRSPLTAMRGYSSLILEGDYGDISADLRIAIERIHVSTNTLTVVVNDYLNISHMELGTMKYYLKPYDLKDLAQSVIDELQPNFDKADVKISLEVDMRQKYMVNIDLDKFKQVIGNLIDNSVKYTPKGSVTISLEKDATKNTVLLAIKDTGIGMKEDVIPKLFAKFSRSENAREVNIRGTGLGLYIAQQIVRAHNGRVWAESEGEGKGSQFYVELPGVV